MKGADRRRARRPGAVVLALLFMTAAAAPALTLLYHLGVPGLVVTFLLGLPGLYLGWVALRRPPNRNLAQIADGLAARLRSQWAREAEARGLNDPYPLPVAWTAAEEPLTGDLDALKTLAASGAGWSAPTRENWAKGPEDLAGGCDRKLADVLAVVPTGRLVVLGEPGTGKTMLMVGLVLDLLARRRRGGLVPVLVSLASWDPVSQDLHSWLGATLVTGYPDLAAAPPPGSAGGNRFEALLEAGRILPVLDGLDELPESARPVAIARINKQLKPGEQVVVTCRTEQYQAAASPQDGQGAVLRAAAVQLSTLEFGEVARYLRTDAGPAEDRWDFLDTLGAGSPVRQALATPLMAGLARAIYNPRPDKQAGNPRHPAELRGFADRAAVEAHLFDEFITAAYRSPSEGRWTAEQTETWLVFLARHLHQTIGGPDLAWWQLQVAVPRTALGLAAGLAGMLMGMLMAALAGVPGGLAGVASPRAVLAGDRQLTLLLMLVGGLVAGLVGGLAAGLRFGLAFGLVFGPVFGLGLSMRETAWPSYMLTRVWLALHRRLPWSLMSFLADAHQRGILRQAGAVYQFRHLELQRRLATRP
jgi:NACHT domain